MTTEICKHCNGWRGLHKWDTMQCPYMGMENENWQATTYEEADDKDARIAELEARVKELEERLGQMTEEYRMDDHNLHYPRCNCQSHQNYHAARKLLETK